MYGGPAVPPGARPIEHEQETKLYPLTIVVAGVLFVLLLVGIVIVLRWLGGGTGAESMQSMGNVL